MNHPKYSTAHRARRQGIARRHSAPRVYVASPLSTYRTPRYDLMAACVRRHFPGADVLMPLDLFTSNSDWLAKWPAILPTLSAFVAFTDEEGWVGRGVWTEVRDARAHGVPVSVLDDAGCLCPWQSVRIAERRPDDWTRTARLELPLPAPEPHTPAWFTSLAAINPRQAATTASVIAATGQGEGCSICGDIAARPYRVGVPPYLTLSVCLCDDCCAIQQTHFGLDVTAADSDPVAETVACDG